MSIYDFEVKSIEGDTGTLEPYRGKVLLIVNVASKCGFTPQYEGLEGLYQEHRHAGLTVLGFPCDQFGHQEPGSETEIRQFCSLNYNVTFPLFAKVEVKGRNAHPLYQHLISEAPGLLGIKTIKWNFTKFLVDRHGRVRRRFAPKDKPRSIEKDIVSLLE